MVVDMSNRYKVQAARCKCAVAQGVAACCLFISVSCPAEDLIDPTRPPIGLVASGVAAVAAVVKNEVVLQSILISNQRRAAIIDGVTVELGGRVGNARLIEINTGFVVLKTGRVRQVVKLFPDVAVTPIQTQLMPAVRGEKK